MDFRSSTGRDLASTGRVPWQARDVFFGHMGHVLPSVSSKSEVGNSDCFVVFSNWKMNCVILI